MKYGIVSEAAVEEIAGLEWARLGDTLLCWTEDDERWPAGLALAEPAAQTPGLYLVTQVGRMFQREHPDIPVLVDKGRYLVVGPTPEQAGAVRAREDVCYQMRPLTGGITVFRTVAPARRAPEPAVRDLVKLVDEDGYRTNLGMLVGHGTRHSLNPAFRAVAERAADLLHGLGYATSLVPITVGSGSSLNVVAEQAGEGPEPRGRVLVTAHLDSINAVDGPAAAAPGADDNGSGAAGLLEIARVLSGRRTAHDLCFILFGGEEQGLFGSRQYVKALARADRDRIRAVVNMDMIGTLNTPAPTVLLEGAQTSQGLIDGLAAAAATYTSLAVQTSLHPFASDHVPFIDAAIPAVLTIEGADRGNGNVHTANDTLAHIDFGLALEIVRMNVAAAAAAAEV
ncbi:M28 family metallopeptidase [Nonomuraea sp. NPDC050451]|uniref:M28 family metallopeptidase n=1 Tax=Nonomuraea sp. NPDC050451 TaxID=3364364 RepID=UPI0037A4A8A9